MPGPKLFFSRPSHCITSCRCILNRFKSIRFLNTGNKIKEVSQSHKLNNKIDIEEKLVYNSKIKFDMSTWRNRGALLREKERNIEVPPIISLKYFGFEEKSPLNNTSEIINLPFQKHHTVEKIHECAENVHQEMFEDFQSYNEDNNSSITKLKDEISKTPKADWIKDYNKYIEVSIKTPNEDSEDVAEDHLSSKYGSADPSISSSDVPCGGCGAHLHCQDQEIPGYLPKEIFSGLNKEQLQAVVCQRCHFLREYNTALSVSVDPETYPQLLAKIKSKTALVLLVVDMTDFPCSIWPGILDVIGPKRPLIVVGNKIDLLQDWSKDWLIKGKEALINQLPAKANILDVTLISAKTGFGVEKLITTLYNCWEYKGDVYLVGCTNVGKSTLFNALLKSDYCKAKAVDLVHRATTAPWPGTTLNLLKFPIMRPEGRRLMLRTLRLREEGAKQLQQDQETKLGGEPQMISNISRTFIQGNTNKYNDDYFDDPFALPKMATLRKIRASGSGLDPTDPEFVNSKWLYDTPGVITPDQIIDLLTTEELTLTLAQEPLVPRSFTVWAGQSLLIGGVGRLDCLSGPNIKMTVLAAATLPVTICFTADVDEVYSHYLGSEVLAVPCGGHERLRLWPGLSAGPQFSLKGEGWSVSCADVVLSSAGWIAVTAMENTVSQLQAYTPGARGIYVRVPPVLPRAIAIKGHRMFKSQAYALYNENIHKVRGR